MIKTYKTSRKNEHEHIWVEGSPRTSVDKGHSHRVTAMRLQVADGHTHQLRDV